MPRGDCAVRADVLECGAEAGKVDGLGAVPVLVLGVDGDEEVGVVEVVLVEDLGGGEEAAEQAREGGFAG